MILQYPTQSWVAIGWRPANISPTCAKISEASGPSSDPRGTHASAEPEPHAVPEGAPQPKPEPAPAWTQNGSFLVAGPDGAGAAPEPNANNSSQWHWNVTRVAPEPVSGSNFSHFASQSSGSQGQGNEPSEIAWTWSSAGPLAENSGTTESSVLFWQPHLNGSWSMVNHSGPAPAAQNLGPFVQTRGPFVIQPPQTQPPNPNPIFNQTSFEIRPQFPPQDSGPGTRNPAFPWAVSPNSSNFHDFENPPPNSFEFATHSGNFQSPPPNPNFPNSQNFPNSPNHPLAGNQTLIEVFPQVYTPEPGQEFVNIPIDPQTQPAVRPFQRVESAIRPPGKKFEKI